MADDAQIRIGLSISTEGLNDGKAQAQAAADAIAAAYDKVAKAALEVKNAQQQQSQILASYKKGTVDQAIAEAALSANMERSAAAAEALGAAREALKSITDQATVSEDQLNQAVVRGISGRQGAAASIGMLEGRMLSGNRAAAGFLATTLGLAPVLEAAFPVIGALALGEVIVQVGKELYTAFDMGGERARKLQEDVTRVTDSLKLEDAEIQVQIDKLNVEADRFDKKPTNQIKLAADEATLATQRLIDKLEQLGRTEKTVLQDFNPSLPQKIFGGQAGTHQEDIMVSEHMRHLAEAKTQQDALNESTSYGNSLQARLTELKGMQAEHEARMHGPGALGEIYTGVNYTREIEATKALIDIQQREYKATKDNIDLKAAEDKEKKASDASDARRLAAEAAREYDRKQMDSANERLNQIKTVDKVSAQTEVDYWEFILKHATVSAENYKRIIEKIAAAKQSVFREQGKADNTAASDEQAAARAERIAELQRDIASAPAKEPLEDMKQSLAMQEQEHMRKQEASALDEKRISDAAKLRPYQTYGDERRELEQVSALHKKNATEDQSYFEGRKDIVASGYRDQIQALDKVYEAEKKIRSEGTAKELQAIQPLKTKGDAGDLEAAKEFSEAQRKIQQDATIKDLESQQKLNRDVEQLMVQRNQQIDQLEKQRAQAASKANQQELEDATRTQQLIVQRYREATTEMNSAIIGGLNQWMTTSKSFGASMVDAAKKMAVAFIDAIVQMELKQLELYILQKVLGQGNQQSQAAGTIATNVTVAESNAAVGATMVFAETGNIAAALAALAEGEALASMAAFEQGGIIPGRRDRGVAILAHGEEAMLPAPLTNMLLNVATAGPQSVGGGGHKFTSVYSPQISILDSKGLEGFARRAADYHGREMRGYARRMNLTN